MLTGDAALAEDLGYKLARALAEARPLPSDWPRAKAAGAARAEIWIAGGEATWRIAVRAVAEVCAQFNPQFDRGRFYEAAGYDEERDTE